MSEELQEPFQIGTVPDLNSVPEVKEKPKVQPALPPKKKVFTRADIKRSIKFQVTLPHIYPDYEPWGFELRLKLSQDAEERRQEYMALSATNQTAKQSEQNLDDLCDLLLSHPTGFGDLRSDLPPGPAFKDYVKTADPALKPVMDAIVEGAITLYWRKISPVEFRS